jgi:hypothetical protein
MFVAVFRIRVFLDLPYPHQLVTSTYPDPLVTSKDPDPYQNVADPEHCFVDFHIKNNNSDRRFTVSSQKKGKALNAKQVPVEGQSQSYFSSQKLKKCKKRKQTKIVYHIVAEDLLVWRTC